MSALSTSTTTGAGTATEEEWEAYKSTIYDIYITQGKTREHVRKEMREVYKFHGSKSQYERHFKKWDFKKYVPNGAWGPIGRNLNANAAAATVGQINYNGISISKKRLKKSLQRYGRKGNDELLRPTNEQLDFSYHTGFDFDTNRLDCINPAGMWHQSLPIISLSNPSSPAPIIGVEHSHHDILCRHPISSPFSILEIQTSTQRLHNCDTLLKLAIQKVMYQSAESNEHLVDRFRAIIPTEFLPRGFNQSWTNGAIFSFSPTVSIRIGLYLIYNGLVPRTKEDAKAFIEWTGSTKHSDLFRLLGSVDEPTSQALMKHVFDLAILAENADLIKRISRIPSFKLPSNLQSELQTACVNQNSELVSALIDAGASAAELSFGGICYKIENMHLKGSRESRAAPGRVRINLDMTQTLLDHGIHHCGIGHSIAGWASTFGDESLMAFLLDEKWPIRDCTVCIASAVRSLHGTSPGSLHILSILQELGVHISLSKAAELQRIDLMRQCLLNGDEWSLGILLEIIRSGDIELIIEVSKLFNDDTRHKNGSISGKSPDFGFKMISLERGPVSVWQQQSQLAVFTTLIDWMHKISRSFRKECLDMCLNVALESDMEYLAFNLIKAGARLNQDAMQKIIQKGPKELVLALIDAEPHLLSLRYSGKIVAAVAKRGDLEIFKAFHFETSMQLENFDFNCKFSPLTIAILNGRQELALLMIDDGVQINYPSINDASPLEAAIKMRNLTLVNRLLQAGANPQDDGALYSAVSNGHEIIEVLFPVAFRTCSNRTLRLGIPALQIAIQQKNSHAIQLLLEYKVPVKELPRDLFDKYHRSTLTRFRKESAVETAIIQDKTKSLEIFKTIMEALGDLDDLLPLASQRKVSPLLLAIRHGNTAAVNFLLDSGADVNETRTKFAVETPLTAAIKKADLVLVQRLIQSGVNIHASAAPRDGMTPLQCAASHGLIPIASILLDMGVHIDAPGAIIGDGGTALEVAAANGRMDMIRFLVSRGAQITGEGGCQFEAAKKIAIENGHHGARMLLETLLADMSGFMSQNVGISNPAPMTAPQGDQAIDERAGEVDLNDWIDLEGIEGISF